MGQDFLHVLCPVTIVDKVPNFIREGIREHRCNGRIRIILNHGMVEIKRIQVATGINLKNYKTGKFR